MTVSINSIRWRILKVAANITARRRRPGVSINSIRWRILKECNNARIHGDFLCFNQFDSVANTESISSRRLAACALRFNQFDSVANTESDIPKRVKRHVLDVSINSIRWRILKGKLCLQRALASRAFQSIRFGGEY